MITALAANGITTTEQLTALNPRELRGLSRVGATTVDAVRELLAAEGLTLAADPWGPYSCARHGQPGADVRLAGFFLCSECRVDFKSKAFRDTEPQWVAREAVDGYCAHRNKRRNDVRLSPMPLG